MRLSKIQTDFNSLPFDNYAITITNSIIRFPCVTILLASALRHNVIISFLDSRCTITCSPFFQLVLSNLQTMELTSSVKKEFGYVPQ